MTKHTKLLFIVLIITLVITVISIALIRENDLGASQFENIENIDVTIKVAEFSIPAFGAEGIAE